MSQYFNARPVFDYKSIYNASITMFLPAIMDKNPNEIVELKWHFPWSDQSFSRFSFFIPIEAILTHWKQPKSIRSIVLKAIRGYRCVVLANCFVVWRQNQPFCVYVQDQRMFAFGGIWYETPSHTGFAILTQSSNELLHVLGQHEMPFILAERHVHYWLRSSTSLSKLSNLMKGKYPALKMNAYPIGEAINDLSVSHPGIYLPVGEKLNPEIDYGVKEKLVRQGWGRNKINDW